MTSVRTAIATITASLPIPLSSPAFAQEMINMPAATAPSPSVLIPRVQTRAYFYEDGQSLLEQDLRLEYGLARDLSVSLDLPFYQGFFDAPRPADGEFGLGDLETILELRVLREDLNAVDTVRVAVFVGAELPTGTADFGGNSVDPCAGGVVTAIFGRHGIDAAARYTFVTGDGLFLPIFATDEGEDFVNLDLGYAFRLLPTSYGEERVAAWYATCEVNAILTIAGQSEVLLSPGLLLEAPNYAIELGLQVPVIEDSQDRPALRLALVVGLRLLF